MRISWRVALLLLTPLARLLGCARMKHIQHYICTGGRPATLKRRVDCVVRALSLFSPWSYEQIENFLIKNHGYTPEKSNSGIRIPELMGGKNFEMAEVKFNVVFNHNRPGLSVFRFIQLFPKGDFLIHMRGHVFVISDGIIFDTGNIPPGSHVFNAWRVEKPQ